MRSFATLLVLAVALALPAPAGAAALDPAAADALGAAMKMLLDPAQRAGAIAGHPQAGPVDQDIRALTRSDALTQELYALAATIFSELVRPRGRRDEYC
jgi:hypothetical protein